MLYSRKTIASIPFQKLSDSFDFDLEMIVMAHIKGLRIQEIAIPTICAGEVSHLKPVQYGLRVLGIVANYKRGKYCYAWGRQSCLQPPFQAAVSAIFGSSLPARAGLKAGCSQDWLPHKKSIFRRLPTTAV
jgi:hypothetical protein